MINTQFSPRLMNPTGRSPRKDFIFRISIFLFAALLIIFVTTGSAPAMNKAAKVTPDKTQMERDPFTPPPKKKEEKPEQKIPDVRKVLSGSEVGLSLTGVIKGENGNRAVVNSPSGSHVIIKGQRLGQWTVDSINEESVIITTRGFIIRLDLPSGKDKKKSAAGEKTGNISQKTMFKLTGIIKTGDDSKAMIETPAGVRKLVSKGQIIGEWTVFNISPKAVLLKKDDGISILSLPDPKNNKEAVLEEHSL